MAIGELQTSMGPDQAVSARASSIDEQAAEPNLLGTWGSWHWSVKSPTPPNYSQKAGKFRRWLASMADTDAARTLDGGKSGFNDPVWLIDPKTVGSPSSSAGNKGPGLRAERVQMQLSQSQKGAFAWAVMDESQKAPFQIREPELEPNAKPPTKAELIARRIAPSRARPEEILPSLAPDVLGDPGKIVSLDSAVVAADEKKEGEKVLSYQADVTPYSVGLLSDVAEGGLKTDLTTLFESANTLPNVNGTETVYNTRNDGAPLWTYLRDHYLLHRRTAASAVNGAPKVALNSSDLRPGGASGGLFTVGVAKERLLPVISKLQIMFSAVSHYTNLGDRVKFFDTYGEPKGNTQYGAPHLVYDTVVTLYNPYDVEITLPKLRVRIWDPPVLFAFKKNNDWLRPEFAGGEMHPLARFMIKNEKSTTAHRFFTLYLTEAGSGGRPYGAPITMKPGEVKVFAPYVEKDWSWGAEVAGGSPKRFFDWNSDNNFGNKDGISGNPLGIETTPGWDARAGLQTDHLAYDNRPIATRYGFEQVSRPPDYPNGMNGGWLAIKNDDTFTVEAKPGRATTNASVPDFRVDVLSGTQQDMDVTRPDEALNQALNSRDLLRTYKFKFNNPESEISVTPGRPKIARTFTIGDMLQAPGDKNPGGKSPFALLTMGAKTTVDANDASSPWLHNQPVVEGADQNTGRIGNALDSYDLRLTEVSDFNQSPGGIEFDNGTKKGYYGASLTASRGVSNVPMFRVPVLPAASLGELVSANLVPTAAQPRVTHAFGNSRAHPLLPSAGISRSLSGGVVGSTGLMLDHSYLLNDALWDGTYFSTVASFSGSTGTAMMPSMDRKTLLTEFFEGKIKLLNSRFVPLPAGKGTLSDQASDLDGLKEDEFSRRVASVLGIKGAFNVNSDSVEAWKAMLSSLRDQQLYGWNLANMSPKDKTGFSRFSLPIAGDGLAGNASIDVSGQVRWAGFRALTDADIENLAQHIVTEIRARGAEDGAPSLTLGEFVNRRLGGASSLQTMEGILQRAIGQSGINDAAHAMDSKILGSVPTTTGMLTNIATPQARSGYNNKTGLSADGSPAMLTQGDLLMALAPVITVRGDTFRVRAYGEAKDPEGKVMAKAWCEAIVQRIPEYLDSADEPEVKPAALEQLANQRFGRRFNVTSFRWLSPEEV
ncbi:hypothetical protein [Luteolibacter sp. Populi]|uniref:hypothetical protein n=1 Tax=Luteolibacter sp. Populi TaxID=3230487 RepID=UPI003466A80F